MLVSMSSTMSRALASSIRVWATPKKVTVITLAQTKARAMSTKRRLGIISATRLSVRVLGHPSASMPAGSDP